MASLQGAHHSHISTISILEMKNICIKNRVVENGSISRSCFKNFHHHAPQVAIEGEMPAHFSCLTSNKNGNARPSIANNLVAQMISSSIMG